MAEPETDKRTEAEAPLAEAADTATVPAEEEKHPSVPSPAAAKAQSSVPPASAKGASSTQVMAAQPTFPASGRASTGAVASAHASGGSEASGTPLAAYEAVARSARLPDLVAIAQKILTDAASTRRGGWNYVEKVGVAADDAKLSRSDADTPFGNALKVLGSGPEGEAERALACAIWAHAVAEARRDDPDRLAGDVLWLATHTAFDATPLLDRALGDEADDLWKAIGARIRRIDDGKGTSLGRGEAIIGCAALAASGSAAAGKTARDVALKVKDKALARLLAGAAAAPQREVRLEGQAITAPRGPVVTAILALTGLLFVAHALRLVAHFALGYRRPSEIVLSESGVRMKTRTEMLGRTLREREHIIVRSGLVRVVREVRYPRAGFYAGLLALALGSYIGVRAFVDGVRAASPSLLLTGLVVVILGIAVDFVLGSLIPGTRGRVRISFVPRTGATLCLADVDATRADEALTSTLSSAARKP